MQTKPIGSGYAVRRLSPRVRHALRALTVGGMKNNDAAKIGGVTPAYLSQVKSSQPGMDYVNGLNDSIDEKAMDTSSLLTKLGREAVATIANLMRSSSNQNITLRASQDLADRSAETQKTQRHHVETFSLNGKDAREIAAAMVEAAKLREDYAAAALGDYIRVPLEIKSGDTDGGKTSSSS